MSWYSRYRYLHVWIRIHKAHEYGSNADQDPQPCLQVWPMSSDIIVISLILLPLLR